MVKIHEERNTYPFHEISHAGTEHVEDVIIIHEWIVDGVVQKPGGDDRGARSDLGQQHGRLHAMLQEWIAARPRLIIEAKNKPNEI